MKRKDLVNEIVDFCLDYKVFNEQMGVDEIKRTIESRLENVEFLETLTSTVFKRAKRYKILREPRVVKILLELDIVRAELESKDYNNS